MMMHPLERYLSETRETVEEFARRTGMPLADLIAVTRGPNRAEIPLLRRISRETGGVVTLGELVSSHGPGCAREQVIDLLERRNERLSIEPGISPDPANDCAAADCNRVEIKTVQAALVKTIEEALPGTTLAPAILMILVNGAIDSYRALDGIIVASDPDRLVQALQPAIEEILAMSPGSPLAAQPVRKPAPDRAHTLASVVADRVFSHPIRQE